ncbi:MAG TPA: protease pro-enzyme activation domain-containing protein [Frankiaceae bacterium]|nr:protease pro-enzyme activation domain-containing protein [Frankiaceae bacterium]
MKRLALLCSLALLPLSPATAAPAPVLLPRAVPAWAVPSARVGDVAGSETVSFQVVLPWRSRAEARRLAYAVSDPASPSYGRHVSPAQWRARFAPSDATVAAVTAWLRSAGLEVGAIPANRLVIPARGPASAVERALGVTFSRYEVAGLALRAPDRAPRVPATLAGVGLRGLDQGAALIRTGDVPDDPPPPLPEEPPTPADVAPPAAVIYDKPCSAYDGATVDRRLPSFRGRSAPAVACATPPAAVRAAYGADAQLRRGVDGSGQTVVMVGSHAIKPLASDVDTWSKRHGIPGLRPGQLRQVSYPGAYQTPVQEPVLRPSVWAVQASTLFETVRTVAPGADLLYVGTTSSFDLLTGTLLAVDGAWGDAVINGWYTTSEDVPQPEWDVLDMVAEQAAATGISLLFAAGDLGDNSYSGGQPTTVYPASEPLATAVGATSLILGRGGRYVRELAWGKAQHFLDEGTWEEDLPATYRGTGGGTSTIHAQPAYQKGVVPASLAERSDGSAGRTVPDLAVMGDAETGMAIGYTMTFPDGSHRYAERRVASSTASTALVTGLLALANDRRGKPVGFANSLLYARRGAFRDVVRYGRQGAGVRVDFLDGATPASGRRVVLKAFEEWGENVPRRGYDTAAGLGSPLPALVASL